MFKPGDKYIQFTRFGGINQGEVKEYYEIRSVDTQLMISYYSPHIKTTKGFILELNGNDGKIYRIDDSKDAKHMLNVFSKIGKSKDLDPEFNDIVNKNFDELL